MKQLGAFLIFLVSLDWTSGQEQSKVMFKDCYDCVYDQKSPHHQEACKSSPMDVTSPTKTCNTPYGCIMKFSIEKSEVKTVTRGCPRLPMEVNNDVPGCEASPTASTNSVKRKRSADNSSSATTDSLNCSCDWSFCNNLDEESARNVQDFRPEGNEIGALVELESNSTNSTSPNSNSTDNPKTKSGATAGLRICSGLIVLTSLLCYSSKAVILSN